MTEPAATGRHVLLYIEDNATMVDLIGAVLAVRPHVAIVSAGTGLAGLDAAREHRPGLVLLDLGLPDMDGTAVLAALKADELTAAIPVVIVTGGLVDEEETVPGAAECVAKPFAVDRLLQVVDRYLPAT